jgi:hypothetical protein
MPMFVLPEGKPARGGLEPFLRASVIDLAAAATERRRAIVRTRRELRHLANAVGGTFGALSQRDRSIAIRSHNLGIEETRFALCEVVNAFDGDCNSYAENDDNPEAAARFLEAVLTWFQAIVHAEMALRVHEIDSRRNWLRSGHQPPAPAGQLATP